MRNARQVVLASLALAAIGGGIAAAKPPPKPAATSVTIAVSPNPATYGSQVTVTGKATGNKSTHATVDLMAKQAPSYSKPMMVASTTTNASGQYRFRTAPSVNAIYFVKVHTAPAATSANGVVKVKVRVTLSLTGGAGHMFFLGFVLPNYSGKSVQIQRRTAHHWKTIAHATLASAGSVPTALGSTTRSKYRKRLRLKSGTYRVLFVPADGLRIANHSPVRKI